MTAMHSFDRITVAGGEVRLRCYCCNEFLSAEDFATEKFQPWFAKAVEDLNGGRVCIGCMDEHVHTEEDDVLPRSDAVRDADGEWHTAA